MRTLAFIALVLGIAGIGITYLMPDMSFDLPYLRNREEIRIAIWFALVLVIASSVRRAPY